MRISIELVPREIAMLENELKLVKEMAVHVDTINIPDLKRFQIRSWEGCQLAKKYFTRTIPHIRAIDFDLDKEFPLVDVFRGCGIQEVLIIQGDSYPESGSREYPNKTVDLIRKMKKEMPELKIYAAIDPYRQEIKREMDTMKEKMDTGVEGFFSQPFFDIRLLEIYAEKLENYSVFWGISPVVTEKSKAYWESRNRAYFPKDFEPTMDWNIRFANKALDFCKAQNYNLYLMPIRIDLRQYLGELFEKEENLEFAEAEIRSASI